MMGLRRTSGIFHFLTWQKERRRRHFFNSTHCNETNETFMKIGWRKKLRIGWSRILEIFLFFFECLLSDVAYTVWTKINYWQIPHGTHIHIEKPQYFFVILKSHTRIFWSHYNYASHGLMTEVPFRNRICVFPNQAIAFIDWSLRFGGSWPKQRKMSLEDNYKRKETFSIETKVRGNKYDGIRDCCTRVVLTVYWASA